MAKVGGSLSANTNLEVLAADMTRTFLEITNVESTSTIYLEVGAAASTTSTDDSIPILPQTVKTFNGGEVPEIKKSVNLKSTGTPQYHVWEGGL